MPRPLEYIRKTPFRRRGERGRYSILTRKIIAGEIDLEEFFELLYKWEKQEISLTPLARLLDVSKQSLSRYLKTAFKREYREKYEEWKRKHEKAEYGFKSL